jgi:hypothetical protein
VTETLDALWYRIRRLVRRLHRSRRCMIWPRRCLVCGGPVLLVRVKRYSGPWVRKQEGACGHCLPTGRRDLGLALLEARSQRDAAEMRLRTLAQWEIDLLRGELAKGVTQ